MFAQKKERVELNLCVKELQLGPLLGFQNLADGILMSSRAERPCLYVFESESVGHSGV